MRKRQRFLTAGFAALLSGGIGSAFAQDTPPSTRTVINGHDLREGPIESNVLQQIVGQMAGNAAHTAALLQIETEDRKRDIKNLEELRDWLKRWCGERPGCTTP